MARPIKDPIARVSASTARFGAVIDANFETLIEQSAVVRTELKKPELTPEQRINYINCASKMAVDAVNIMVKGASVQQAVPEGEGEAFLDELQGGRG